MRLLFFFHLPLRGTAQAFLEKLSLTVKLTLKFLLYLTKFEESIELINNIRL